jgi:hypothetical protein
MDFPQVLTSIVNSIAWPVALVLSLLLFRKRLDRLLPLACLAFFGPNPTPQSTTRLLDALIYIAIARRPGNLLARLDTRLTRNHRSLDRKLLSGRRRRWLINEVKDELLEVPR